MPLPLFRSLSGQKKDEVQQVITVVGNRKGIYLATKLCFNSPLFNMDDRKVGNPAKLQDGVPAIMKVIDLMPCREDGGENRRIFLMSQTA